MRYLNILFLSFIILLSACDDNELVPGGGIVVDPELQITVLDASGEIVSGADVTLYSSEADYITVSNAVGSGTTSADGTINFPLEGLQGGVFYFSAKSGDLRNWDNNTTITLTVTSGVTEISTVVDEINPVSVAIAGPDSFTSGQENVSYSIASYPGKYEWVVTGGENFTTPRTDLNRLILSTEKNELDETLNIQLTATPDGFDTFILEKEVVVAAFCDYDASLWTGAFTALEDYGAGTYGPYDIEMTADQTDPNKVYQNNFWDYGSTVYYLFDPNTTNVTIPQQTITDGEAPGTISGAGTYDQCSGTFSISVVFVDASDDSVNEFIYTHEKQ